MTAREPGSEPLAYRPQLDTLRAVAVSSVLVTHLLLPFGPAHQGVRLFFVISGFLITAILLKQRDDAGQPLSSKFRTFYFRRAIRIWPIYYATLLGAALVNLSGINASLPWHLLYLSNFYYMRIGSWDPWVAGHLWSLAVEEQFYLLWPAVVLLVPRRALVWVLIGGVALAVIYRWGMSFALAAFPDIGTPAAFDALCMGGALALAKHVGTPYHTIRLWLWPAAALAIAALLPLAFSSNAALRFALEDLLFAVLFTAMVAAADAAVGGRLKRVLELPPLLYIGRISYGIYLYHLFVAYVVLRAAGYVGIELPNRGPATFMIVSGLTIAAASLSWFAVEKPLARWKRRFSYNSSEQTGRQAP